MSSTQDVPLMRKLDTPTALIVNRLANTPQEKRTQVENLFYDVLVAFKEGQPMVYRLIWLNFPERKLRLVRHRKTKEEYGMYIINTISKFENNKLKLELGESMAIIIQPQSVDDLNAIYRVFRMISLNHTLPITKEEFLLDTVVLKRTYICKKRGKTFWNKRVINVYNGCLYLYESTTKEIPLTIIPICECVKVIKQGKESVKITSYIRSFQFKFESEEERDDLVEMTETSQQVIIPPYVNYVRDFFTGNLNDLISVCRDECIKSKLYPEECDKYFPVLCEVVKSATKRRYVTNMKKRGLGKDVNKTSNESKKETKLEEIDDGEELATIAEKDDIYNLFANFVSIGKGGFGEVFVATRKSDGKQIALKTLKHSADERYSKIGIEVSRLYHFRHPNIVGFEGCWIYDNQVHIGMEYCSQGTLKQLLKSKSRFNEADSVFLVRETLRALQYIHEYGFIHRDIKTANIMLSSTYSVKVIDFGLVIRESNKPSNRAGSKAYMAPEVIKQEPYDCKVDVWSLGCVAQELVEGYPPYKEVGLVKGTFKTATIGAMGLRFPGKVSNDFKVFLSSCFMFDPKMRPKCEDLLKMKVFDEAEGSTMKKQAKTEPIE
ncbi:serine/threonine protein kinase PAK, putative [Entamoeba invadens IP1]|uniref:Serine/threonine protein kinase PAK, putative n=1 Tax=Entamoeba invadens IP1 TaxID=370355 RepID=A0A0A1UCG4_ENTIV|nr:serine/threonine protein kinase PAK, putative [Entamoeba invadens IP1]ELP92931.1 serine/threonine protein kinase PAK, putative [Entamoeba invadens IP1]|eukprot:XP_004259702.1 serine/threonine protein kinase PAK, putative [Entamoeba invadens IP1]